MRTKPSLAIIGGGPAALMLACGLDKAKFNISLYEKNNALGRKFLVAGKGGFNLTHSEDKRQFGNRYTPKGFMHPFLENFSNHDFIKWLEVIGINTFVGSSKRVFPVKGTKPIEVLKAVERTLLQNEVSVFYQYQWKGWEDDALIFDFNNEIIKQKPDIIVFALGGASWKVTGSDGEWMKFFDQKKINVHSFAPSNCAFKINWDLDFIAKHNGKALKNCVFSCNNQTVKGEATLTEFGIEGSGVYPLSGEIRKKLMARPAGSLPESEMLKQVQHNKAMISSAQLTIDLKPDLSFEEIKLRLDNNGKLSVKNVLEKKLNFTSVQIDLLKHHANKDVYQDAHQLAALIKRLPLTVTGLAPLDEAISTVGGIDIGELTENLELKKLPQHYCIGEMIDWDAPTGGYLLQACFSMGYTLAKHLNETN